jgi:hypothetical protein
MKRAAMSSSTVDGPVGKMVLSLERLGRVSIFIRNCVLSPSRRGVRRVFSSWGERGGTEPGTICSNMNKGNIVFLIVFPAFPSFATYPAFEKTMQIVN